MTAATPLRLAALLSGGGRTLLNLVDRIEDGTLPAEVGLVVASRDGVAGIERARARGLEVRVRPSGPRGDETLTQWLVDAGVDLVCLCGYLRLVPTGAPFAGRILNIHPALLPAFGGKGMYGLHVHRAVLASGRAYSGCTVHFVDEQYDHGPTILQRCCPVRGDDDAQRLADRVFVEECLAYPEAIRLVAAGRVRLAGGRVLRLPPPSLTDRATIDAKER